MKKLLLPLFGVLAFGLFFSSCSEMDPLEYEETIGTYYSKLDDQLVDIIDAIYDSTKTVNDLQNEIDYCQTIIDINLPKLKDMKELSKDPGFLNATIDFYELADDLLSTKFQEIMDIYNDTEPWTDEKGKSVDNLVREISNDVIDGEEDVTSSEEAFAQVYNINLF